jgi:hypothetical protein
LHVQGGDFERHGWRTRLQERAGDIAQKRDAPRYSCEVGEAETVGGDDEIGKSSWRLLKHELRRLFAGSDGKSGLTGLPCELMFFDVGINGIICGAACYELDSEWRCIAAVNGGQHGDVRYHISL